MNALVVGGTGLIGAGITRELVAAGHDVTLFNRGRTDAQVPDGVGRIEGDRTDHDDFVDRMENVDVDAVIDMDVSYGSLADVESAIAAFSGRIDHYVYTSTGAVYRRPTSSTPVTEDAPLKSPGEGYGQRKVACERRLREAHAEEGFPATILRPGHTYGPGGVGSGALSYSLGFREPTFLRRLRDGKPIVVHGDGTSLWGFCHRDDVARAFVAALGDEDTVGEAYHLANPESVTWNAYVRLVADALDAPDPELVHVPSDLLAAILPPRRNQFAATEWDSSWVYDSSKANEALGFEVTVPLAEGIEETVAWLDDRGRIDGADPGELDDRVVAAWRSAASQFTSALEPSKS